METTTLMPPIAFEPRQRGGVMFGPVLRKLRDDRNESLEQAARGMGIYASTLYRLEKGSRGAGDSIARAVCQYYDVSLDSIRTKAD